jgi:hypothetical protein
MTNIADAINWTDFGSVISGFGGIIPDVISLVINMVPLFIVLALVGFIVGFFDKIVEALGSALSFVKK